MWGPEDGSVVISKCLYPPGVCLAAVQLCLALSFSHMAKRLWPIVGSSCIHPTPHLVTLKLKMHVVVETRSHDIALTGLEIAV